MKLGGPPLNSGWKGSVSPRIIDPWHSLPFITEEDRTKDFHLAFPMIVFVHKCLKKTTKHSVRMSSAQECTLCSLKRKCQQSVGWQPVSCRSFQQLEEGIPQKIVLEGLLRGKLVLSQRTRNQIMRWSETSGMSLHNSQKDLATPSGAPCGGSLAWQGRSSGKRHIGCMVQTLPPPCRGWHLQASVFPFVKWA